MFFNSEAPRSHRLGWKGSALVLQCRAHSTATSLAEAMDVGFSVSRSPLALSKGGRCGVLARRKSPIKPLQKGVNNHGYKH